jgi:hypothetical protein
VELKSPQPRRLAHCESFNTAFLYFLVSGVNYEYLEGRIGFYMIQALCSSIYPQAVLAFLAHAAVL